MSDKPAGVKRQKDLLYHRATFLQDTDKTLQQHLDSVWAKLGYASAREQKFGGDNDSVRLWNRRTDRGLMLCGLFHSWEHGRSQLVIQVKEGVAEYAVVATNPPVVKGAKDTQFNEGLLFFGAYKNHVLALQSSALRVTALSDYLNWLLQDATTELPKNNRVELATALPRKLTRDAPPLKSIVLMPPIHSEVVVDRGAASTQGGGKDLKMRVDKAAWKWLREAMREMGGQVPNDLLLDRDFNPERLQVKIELRWLGRDKERDQTPVLDTIMRAFRDVDDPPIKAITANGEEITGNDLRLRKTVSVEVDGKIPVAGDVFEQMQKYLTELLQRGDIPAE